MNMFEWALKRNEHCQLPVKVVTQEEARNLPKHDVWRYRNFDSFLNSLYDMLYYEYDIPLETNPHILQHKPFEEIIEGGEKND